MGACSAAERVGGLAGSRPGRISRNIPETIFDPGQRPIPLTSKKCIIGRFSKRKRGHGGDLDEKGCFQSVKRVARWTVTKVLPEIRFYLHKEFCSAEM